jgi:tRNA modification GTPase
VREKGLGCVMSDNHLDKDTIAAVATPLGQAGIGIVRMSGPLALQIAKRIFKPRNPANAFQTHQLVLGHLVDPSSGQMLDEVLLCFMKAPHSYTREDVVEINSHSGYLLLSTILQIVLSQGARLSNPGEFTFRAFMNGRIDLTQAEAVMDLIHSKSRTGLRLASQQIKGEFGAEIERLRQKVVDILARIEVAIDYPEEEYADIPGEEMGQSLSRDVLEPIEKIMAAHSQRKIWMDGINTVIVGCVNVGKSSLLNRLLKEERAIVTPIPGTTRDIIESFIHIEGIPIRLMDTAGFREVQGEVEQIGIRLAEEKMADADLSLIVLDQSRSLMQDDLDILAKADRERSLILLNKIDLEPKMSREKLNRVLNGIPVARISALTGEGIDGLHKAIRHHVLASHVESPSSHLAPNLRHRQAMMEASTYFKDALRNLRQGLPLEIIAVDLRSGLEALGEIIGETTSEDIIEKIFSEFCLGK